MELRELLEIGPGLTALIGGGGKTTLMYHLASELRQQGTVLVCTTTKIWPPAHLRVCTEEGTLREELRRRGITHLPVVYSPEEASEPDTGETPPPGRRSVPGSLVWVPASAGLLLCQYVVTELIK